MKEKYGCLKLNSICGMMFIDANECCNGEKIDYAVSQSDTIYSYRNEKTK